MIIQVHHWICGCHPGEFHLVMPPRNKDVAAKYFLTFYPGADEAAAIFGTSVGKVRATDRMMPNRWHVLACCGMCVPQAHALLNERCPGPVETTEISKLWMVCHITRQCVVKDVRNTMMIHDVCSKI